MSLQWPQRDNEDKDKGWSGKRHFDVEDILKHEDMVNFLLARFEGQETLERRAVELNDICAEHATPYKQMILQFGEPGYRLWTALAEAVENWNSQDKDLGMQWKVIQFGLENFRNPCRAMFTAEQPRFWIRCDYLSDRLWRENLEVDRQRQARGDETKPKLTTV